MDGVDQCDAYAMADFAAVNAAFVEAALDSFASHSVSTLIDLGCGPADITIRMCRALPELRATAVDASGPMLDLGGRAASQAGLADRLALHTAALPLPPPQRGYDAIISNSLLHHLPDPMILWEEVKRQAYEPSKGTSRVYIMDLLRPADTQTAQGLVDTYAPGEPEILRVDFYNSLLAAYRPSEIQDQLAQAGLSQLVVETPTDRHIVVRGAIDHA